MASNQYVTLPPDQNQARGLAQYAMDSLRPGGNQPSEAVFRQLERFHLDSVACAVSAIAYGTNAPCVLRKEALNYAVRPGQKGACCFADNTPVAPEKAVVANSSAAREWDSNGTNFGYNPSRGHTQGEFGHNDFYPVAIAGAQVGGHNGRTAAVAMIVLDEIRGRLAEVFSLKDHKIDHVLHGAIASAAVYGALTGATVDQIESAIGMVVAHYVPFRAIRAGHQLSDSKGASAAISAEAAVLCAKRAMAGFVGPADIFRNPQAVFCLFEKPHRPDCSPFELVLATAGSDYALMGMHLKLGLYEHQSAGAIAGLLELLGKHRAVLEQPTGLQKIKIRIYEPAFSIIGDPAKKDPHTRQSADHSMVYIIATLLRKAWEKKTADWAEVMLLPDDYSDAALFHPTTRQIMSLVEFEHGGPDFDARYPDGIPTTVDIHHATLGECTSGLVMYPAGHARSQDPRVGSLFEHKFTQLASLAVTDVEALRKRFSRLEDQTADQMANIMNFALR